jgi:DNA polymerase-3 subunit delta'
MKSNYVLHPHTQKSLDGFLQRPSHATLLYGPTGVGTTSIAVLLAAELLGSSLAHLPNEQYYRFVGGEGSIAIETIRSLRPFFALSVPGTASVKRVVVIDNAETMTTEAQNALLKLLEEPPSGSVLLLTSSRPERLLATIRSRLNTLQLQPPAKAAVIAHFVALGHTEATVERAYLLSGGSLARMQVILSEDGEAGGTFETVKQVLSGEPFERLLQVDKLAKDKDAAKAFVDALLQIAGMSAERAAAQNPGSLPRWQAVMAASVTAQEALARSGNTKLVLTDLMLSL